MHIWDLINLITYNLIRRKNRVLLTALGVVIGTAAVILMISLSNGLKQGATTQFSRMADLKRIEVFPSYGKDAGGGIAVSSETNKKAAIISPAIIDQIKNMPEVDAVVIQDNLKSNFNLQFGHLQSFVSVVGVNTNDLAVYDYILKEGDSKLERGTAIIGGWAAKNFTNPNQRPGEETPPPPELLGQQIRLVMTKNASDGTEIKKTVYLRVVGVLVESRSSADGSLYVRLEDVVGWNEWATGKRINRSRDGYDSLVVKAKDVKDSVTLADQLNTLGLMAWSPSSIVQGINSFFLVLQIFFGGVGAISLLVAAIGIANTMTMSVMERTAEIGLIKAIGASDSDVLSIFLGEAAGIGFFGGLGGILLGWLAGQVLNMVALVYFLNRALRGEGAPPSVVVFTPLWLPIVSLIMATLVGMVSGYFPARGAMHMPPVTALKHE
jgi:putative ABC transport system permease protein